MLKKILISIGVLVAILALGIWIYLMIYGAPNAAKEVFSNFGIGDSNETSFTPSQNTSDNDRDGTGRLTSNVALQKLTDRSVAGMIFTDSAVRYAERGTGHIFEIQPGNTGEQQMSITTKPRVTDAFFSPAGNRVVLLSESDAPFVGTITRNDNGEGIIDGSTLPYNAREMAFTESGDIVQFLIGHDEGSTGYSYNLLNDAQSIEFDIPLRDIRVIWVEDRTYVYTTPTATQLGSIYNITNGTLEYMLPSALGLSAKNMGESLLVTNSTAGEPGSILFNESIITDMPLGFLPEKCVENPNATTSIYCAAPLKYPNADYPDDWYKGVISLSDALWEIDLTTKNAYLLTAPESEYGTRIDVSSIIVNASGTQILFLNKMDDSLWLFDTTI
jgi:hypothetical protein